MYNVFFDGIFYFLFKNQEFVVTYSSQLLSMEDMSNTRPEITTNSIYGEEQSILV